MLLEISIDLAIRAPWRDEGRNRGVFPVEAKQREHVRMAEATPHRKLITKPLPSSRSV